MSGDRWTRVAESGTTGALRLGGWLHRTLGRAPTVALLWLPALYYVVRRSDVRRASRAYLARVWAAPEGRAVLGRPPGFADVVGHVHAFAESLYDRLVVWGGALDSLEVTHDGSGRIFGLARGGRGALLLGAHLGSFDLLWLLSRKYRLAVNVVAFYDNARRINAFFESHAPDARVRVIPLDPASVRAAFEIRACLERGEFVVILADRVAPGRTARAGTATFLGRPARFPLGPFELAGVLDCPVLFALCVRTGTARYETILRELGAPGRVPRREREKQARELLERYTRLLESFCLRTPFQWFNFYDFWAPEETA